jgi:hypothetical protein
VTWSFDIEPGGLVWPNPGDDRLALREALWDGVGSLSPAGVAPSLSTYWIDMALAALSSSAPPESVVASGNAWSLRRNGDRVVVQLDYADEGDEPADTIPVDELSAELTAYRDAVFQAVESGHKLDERWWAQHNPA